MTGPYCSRPSGRITALRRGEALGVTDGHDPTRLLFGSALGVTALGVTDGHDPTRLLFEALRDDR
jgi:hypothetical protein